VPAGDAKASFVDVRDIAAVAVQALGKNGESIHIGKSYDITGAEAFSYGEAAEILSKELAKKKLLVEPKFIFSGGRVGHIEDVAVRADYQRRGIGFKLVKYATEQAELMGCVRTVLDCSDENIPFYEKIGYSYHSNTMKIQYEQNIVT